MGELLNYIFQKFNKLTLNRKELAEILGISISTLDLLLQKNELPIRYKRLGSSEKAKYIFPISEVANYLETFD